MMRQIVCRLRSRPTPVSGRGALHWPASASPPPPTCGASGQIGVAPAGSMSFLLMDCERPFGLVWPPLKAALENEGVEHAEDRQGRQHLALDGADVRAVDDDDVAA